MIDNILNILHSISPITIAFRLLLALICGGIIGFERGRKGRPAGLRTHILVCIGSSLAMITNQYLYNMGTSTDVARMGAQVISGVSFLGAGTIIITGRHQVKGLTTAASLWACACLGLTVGCGFYSAALLGTLSIWVVNSLLHRLEVPIHSRVKIFRVYIEFREIKVIREMMTFLKENKVKVSDLEFIKADDKSKIGATLTLIPLVKVESEKLQLLVNSIDGVEYLEEI
ncbi:MgtC/SapB family protein [Anaerocolumna sp. MB42-C2]|uniref:MgtC/SapB family protein n=1 Tax=Anaerocolumna sp. MB42-C2 TaxID=3070997 RepID=UPI0027DEF628|nr:MgtC/SapB family protein [Anaerocolumna sp. MB42-C2]WMJ86222.1 MgtC/SapB family protein [Anaerocolumna sp. MB42-C2]